jgi:Tol biopolymer transport system component
LIGAKIGPYEITAKLGEGGMGEVYRATDSKLRREVAIKVLPSAFVADRERLSRFEREAQLLAQLNHPNIAAIHGLEESGGVRALVMELVEGPTLADRLEDGALPLAESVAIARRIAEALEEAHGKGIVHRDLKPQNVKADLDGRVKVLDFGLAKAMDPIAAGPSAAAQLAHSPTLTMGATLQGVILGTAAYMSPEQAKGLPVDKRTDIWSLGVLLLEMLTGRRAFPGDTATETLAAVLRAEIPLGDLPPGTPGSIRRLLRRCLERDRANRLHDVADVRIVLADLEAGRSDDSVPSVPIAPVSAGRTRSRALGAVLALTLSAAAFVFGWFLHRPPAKPVPAVADDAVVRKVTFEPGLEAEPSFSPDGNYVAYTTNARGSLDIAVLPVAGGEVRYLVESAADEAHPAWSPDGTRVAYTAAHDEAGRLRALGGLGALTPFVQGHGGDIFLAPAAGGTSVRLVDRAAYPTWSPDGQQIAFLSDRGGQWDIWRIPARGGEPTQVVNDDLIDYQPAWSPDGKWIAFASISGLRVVRSEGGAAPLLLVEAGSAILSPSWSADGHWLYFSWNRTSAKASLWRLELGPDGRAASAPERISLGGQSDIDLAIGAGGRRLAWSRAEYAPDLWELERASGALHQVTSTSSSEDYPQLSPDGRSIVHTSDRTGRVGIWILDRQDGRVEAMTPPEISASAPRWSPDGRSVVYATRDEAGRSTIRIQERGGLTARVLARATADGELLAGPSWSRDGSRIVFSRSPERGEQELVTMSLSGDSKTLARFPVGSNINFPCFLGESTVVLQNESGGEPRQIFSVPAAGGEPRQLTHGTAELSHPQGSPIDDDEILVVVDHKNVAIVSAARGDVTLLTHFDDSTVLVDYPSWSADGLRIEFSITRKVGDLFLLENPAP